MKFAVPGTVSAVIGALVGLAVVFLVTHSVEQNSRPRIDRSGDAGSSLLNNVEYGSR
jgi:hypothetical protein